MTAIGATPEGIDENEVARRVADMTPDRLQAYAADVRRWIIGPYHGGPTDAAEARIRALALVDIASGGRTRPIPGAVAVEHPAPGSDSDPAYSSPTPAAGPVGLGDTGDPTDLGTARTASAAADVVHDPAPGELEQSAPGAEPELPEGRPVETIVQADAPDGAEQVAPAATGRATRRKGGDQ